MKGQFRLYYLDGKVENLAQGVRYEVVDSTGTTRASGSTDAQGQTAIFEGAADAEFQLRVPTDVAKWESPDTVSGPDESTRMQLAASGVGIKLQKVRLKPFHQVRFISHADHKPIAGAKYTAYALDANGKKGIARDSVTNTTITGTTDKEGKTKLIWCGSSLVFEFEVPGVTVKVASTRLQPRLQGQPRSVDDVALKTVRAMTAPKVDHTAPITGKTSLPALISPQDEELILVGQTDYEEFEEVSGRLDKIMAAMHVAKLDLTKAIESGQQSQIEAAEKALAGAEDKVKSELNSNFSKSADLKEVITLESYGKGGGKMGLRRRYLRTDRYMQLRNKRLNQKEYKLNLKFAVPVIGTQVGQTINPKTLDTAALKDSFKKISTSIKNTAKWSNDQKVLNLLDVAGNEFAETIVQSETYQVDAQAQWLRLVGCAGANAEVDWKSKKAVIQGNLQGKLVLCEGKITGQWGVPSIKGWMIELAGEDLGAVRFLIEVSLYGFAGAKVVASGAVGITLEQGKQVAKAIKNEPKQSFAKMMHPVKNMPKFDPMAPFETTPKDLNGVTAELDAFAGVEAGVTPAGKIQWLSPHKNDFVSFAEISGTFAGNAGAGASASLAVYYAMGKFRVRAAARLCWGLGAKGAVEFTVDASKIAEFATWMHYQLLYAGFRKLLYIEQLAFQQFSQLLVLLINKGYLPGDAKAIEKIEKLAASIDEGFEALKSEIEVAEQRNALVNNINRSPHWLVHAPPETRGMLLYQITRHGKPSHARDLPEYEGPVYDANLYFLPTHKKAICIIMKTVQTAAEWDNVMQHMTADGLKSPKPSAKNEGDVVRFLNSGLWLPEMDAVLEAVNTRPQAGTKRKKSGNTYLDEYLTYRDKVVGEFPKGHKVAALDTPEFDMLAALDGAPHPSFAVIETACIGQAFAGELGSSVA